MTSINTIDERVCTVMTAGEVARWSRLPPDEQLARLRAAIRRGIDSGQSELTMDAIWARIRIPMPAFKLSVEAAAVTEKGRNGGDVPKEVKDSEYRVGLVQSAARALTLNGRRRVLIEKSAGVGSALTDDAYVAAGAEIAPDAERVFAEAKLIVKVKEPLAVERKKLRHGQHSIVPE